MSETAIRAAIVAKLGTVSGIGPVHGRERWSRSFAKWLELMRDTANTVNGWMVALRAIEETVQTIDMTMTSHPLTLRTYRYEITGIYALDDENDSDADFTAIVDGICTAFRTDPTLGGVAIPATDSDAIGVQVAELATDDYGLDTIYHLCRLTYAAAEYL